MSMANLENVLQALDCCVDFWGGDAHKNRNKPCEECPYKDQEDTCSKKANAQMLQDARRLLEKQRARVMSLEEVQTAENCMEPVFLEMREESSTPDVFSWRTVKHIVPLN